jgi:hypothetical protein
MLFFLGQSCKKMVVAGVAGYNAVVGEIASIMYSKGRQLIKGMLNNK